VSSYDLSHLSDSTLLRSLATLVSRDRVTTAEILAHMAEVDARKLYRQAAYPSMYAYGVGELRMSEDAAYKRIQAARVARRFPAVFTAVADGRLHLSAVCLLAPHITEDTAAELLAVATHKTKSEIEQLLAQRFPRPDLPTLIEAMSVQPSPGPSDNQLAPGQVECPSAQTVEGQTEQTWTPAQLAPGQVVVRPRVTPLAPERFALQVTIGQSTHDKLRYAQALLGHQVPASDVAAVLDRALDALIHGLEKRKFAATEKPRQGRRRAPHAGRHIPAEVRRAVWTRDGGQCTFVSATGHRCPARSWVEFDHVDPVARGGQSTISGLQLRCRAHNQYEAERTFGTEFMRHKRLAAAETRASAKARAARTHATGLVTAARPFARGSSPGSAKPPARTGRPAPPAAAAG
jgi:5-methylcytosine-specific restriction endonuclease McrA